MTVLRTRTPPPRTAEQSRGVRDKRGRLMAAIAALPTALAATGVVLATQTSGTEADIYWVFAGVLALIAAVLWLLAIILLRPRGWAVPAFAVLLAVLVAAGAYGGVRDGENGIPVVIASGVVLVGCVVTLIWNRAARSGR